MKKTQVPAIPAPEPQRRAPVRRSASQGQNRTTPARPRGRGGRRSASQREGIQAQRPRAKVWEKRGASRGHGETSQVVRGRARTHRGLRLLRSVQRSERTPGTTRRMLQPNRVKPARSDQVRAGHSWESVPLVITSAAFPPVPHGAAPLPAAVTPPVHFGGRAALLRSAGLLDDHARGLTQPLWGRH